MHCNVIIRDRTMCISYGMYSTWVFVHAAHRRPAATNNALPPVEPVLEAAAASAPAQPPPTDSTSPTAPRPTTVHRRHVAATSAAARSSPRALSRRVAAGRSFFRHLADCAGIQYRCHRRRRCCFRCQHSGAHPRIFCSHQSTRKLLCRETQRIQRLLCQSGVGMDDGGVCGAAIDRARICRARRRYRFRK